MMQNRCLIHFYGGSSIPWRSLEVTRVLRSSPIRILSYPGQLFQSQLFPVYCHSNIAISCLSCFSIVQRVPFPSHLRGADMPPYVYLDPSTSLSSVWFILRPFASHPLPCLSYTVHQPPKSFPCPADPPPPSPYHCPLCPRAYRTQATISTISLTPPSDS